LGNGLLCYPLTILDGHTRFLLTCRSATDHGSGACRPARGSFSAQQRALNEFRRMYNEKRPRHALGMQIPASLYAPSERGDVLLGRFDEENSKFLTGMRQ
jgi:transposase InsO family protein